MPALAASSGKALHSTLHLLSSNLLLHCFAQVGEVFLIVDAGGGTIDFTMHEVLDQGGNKVLGEATHRAMLLDVSGALVPVVVLCPE